MSAPFTLPIPTYQCHKRVQALKIKAMVPNPRGYELHFEDERFVPMLVDASWVARQLTGDNGTDQLIGGYVVWYAQDGYVSWSPAAAFEAGYTLVEPKLDLMACINSSYAAAVDNTPLEVVPVGPATQAARGVGR